MYGPRGTRRALVALVLTASSAVAPFGGGLLRAASPTASAGALPPTNCPPGVALPSGSIATIAGTGSQGASGDGGPATAAGLQSRSGTIAFDPAGALYLGDTAQGSVRRIGPDGIISTYARGFQFPQGVAIDAAGDIYVADHVQFMKRIDPSGAVTTVAGTSGAGSGGNEGPATLAHVGPVDVAIGPDGDLYFDDTNSYRTIDAAGIIHAFAGTGTAGFAGDGGAAVEAMFAEDVVGVAADPQGNVFLGDPGNHRIRKVDSTGIVTTIAGTGQQASSGDGGPATDAAIDTPVAITVDASGNIYFSDDGSNTVRRIDPAGIITTVAGTGSAGFSGDCGPATAAQLDQPAAVAVHDGALYIVDSGNNRVRILMP